MRRKLIATGKAVYIDRTVKFRSNAGSDQHDFPTPDAFVKLCLAATMRGNRGLPGVADTDFNDRAGFRYIGRPLLAAI